MSNSVRGTVLILNAWAIAPQVDGTPYRDGGAQLVCTLCGETISTCAKCSREFHTGERIEADGCIEQRLRPKKPMSWTWRRMFALGATPQDRDELEWVSVPNRPHRCTDADCRR